MIFQNSAKTIETHAAMELSEYISVIAPRWETIGLIFALVGTATYHIRLDDAVFSRDVIPGGDQKGLRIIAIAASDMCLQFCNSAIMISDPLCWATMQHTSFLLEMHGSNGESSIALYILIFFFFWRTVTHRLEDHRVWQRLGDVTTLVFSLGLHQREVDERAPFFLIEIRKRTMVAAYSMDKAVATFLGRPPRITRRYCNFSIPLDIGWEDLLADASSRHAAIQRLDSDGWDRHGGSEGTKPRVSMLTSSIREMVLEISHDAEVDNLVYKVESVL